MDLSIQKLSKAFNQKQIFTDLTFIVEEGSRLAITGSNGSGKSTLLKILSGGMLPSSGSISYKHEEKNISEDRIFRFLHFVAPYNSVIEELSLSEIFILHRSLGMLKQFSGYKEWSGLLNYTFKADQPIKSFSSGMKQRVKLGLALLDQRPLILLDEPTSNLDEQGKAWFFDLLKKMDLHQTLIIASNDASEIAQCSNKISVESTMLQLI